jgi:hypothetical protein
MSSGWLADEATTTMEGGTRGNQHNPHATEDAWRGEARDVMVEAGVAVRQKNYAAEREGRGKRRESCQIC